MTLSIDLQAAPPAQDDLRRRLVADLPVADRRLRLAGIPTAVLEGGAGPPIVLLHGPAEFAAFWLRVIPDLVKTNTVIAPDLPGHGASGVGDRPLDAERVMTWIAELVERTCPTPPVLVGHLVGGSLAARFAARHPEDAGALVLVDTFGLTPLRPSPALALALIPFMVRPTPSAQRRLMSRCMMDLDALRATMGERLDLIEAYALDRARTGDQKAAVRRLIADFGRHAIPREELARIMAPTTLIWGRHDSQCRLSVAEAASVRHGWPLHVIDGARDDPAVEQPEAFLRALRAALTTEQAKS